MQKGLFFFYTEQIILRHSSSLGRFFVIGDQSLQCNLESTAVVKVFLVLPTEEKMSQRF